jgi:LysR family transcriptional regulator, hydrogen peroxide-inducible genes activator
MEMHQAKYFIAVCQTLNFTRAAKQCGITQPALTRAIQRLEHDLGGQLFRRERGRTHVTKLGRIVRPHFEQLFESCAAIKSDSRAFLSLEKADATLGIMFTIGAGPLVGFLTDFRAAHPGITITLREGIPTALIELLLNGEIDVAVLAPPGPLDRRLNARFLYRERLSVAFPSSHRFADQRTVSVGDLEGENYLARMNCETQRRLTAICKAHNVAIREICRSEREDWIQLLVANGAGICFLPEYSAVIPDLRIFPLGNPELMRDISAVTVAGRRFSPAMRKLIQAINRHAWLPISKRNE